MFRCENEFCKKVVESGQPVNRITTECREKEYVNDVMRRERVVGVKESKGSEIVKEIAVCPKCFQKLTGKQPRLVAPKPIAIPQKRQRFDSRPPRRKKWQNPRDREGTSSRSAGSTSQQSSTMRPSQNSSPKKPIVEKVNPIPVIK